MPSASLIASRDSRAQSRFDSLRAGIALYNAGGGFIGPASTEPCARRHVITPSCAPLSKLSEAITADSTSRTAQGRGNDARRVADWPRGQEGTDQKHAVDEITKEVVSARKTK